MSTKLTNLVAEARIGERGPKSLLAVIADQSADNGTGCYSSYSYFVWRLEAGLASVKRWAGYLKKKKLVSIAGRGRGGTNKWVVNVGQLEALRQVWSECEVCGATGVPIETDHWIPTSKDGADEDFNKVRLCMLCNAEKSDRLPEEFLKGREDILQKINDRLEGVQNGMGVSESFEKVSKSSEKVSKRDPKHLEPKEKTYSPEMEELYKRLIEGWKKSFPMRQQPRPWSRASVKLKDHVAARITETDFTERWARVLWDARTSKHLQESGWFTLEYFTRNEDNWTKIETGAFSGFDKQLQEEADKEPAPLKLTKADFEAMKEA